MLKRTLVALALLLPAAAALATESYVSLGTTNFMLDGDFSGTGLYNGNNSVDIESENGLSFGIGFRSGAATNRYLIRASSFDIGGFNGDATLSVYDFGADHLFGADNARVRPYLGGTLGYADFSANSGFLPYSGSDSDGGITGGLAAGLIWDMSPHLFLELRAEQALVNREIELVTGAAAPLPGAATLSLDTSTSFTASLAFRF